MRILITGSRDWTDHETIGNAIALQYLASNCPNPQAVTVVHGGAKGADYLAATLAKRQGFKVELHKARWDEFGKAAGYLRNKEMVEAGADVCLAFIRNESKGATMCAKLAKDAGIPTHIWRE